ncbi:BA75_05058T0 [Komagataella pastoris]|uniref:protein-tyrosine-phosphatase n=1 Tax=Komagataella pastoris TaxID=4922 RepID=A0A1B2JIG6_PICPA|nr:BA75_05058T0 [Komagataella pastoris]
MFSTSLEGHPNLRSSSMENAYEEPRSTSTPTSASPPLLLAPLIPTLKITEPESSHLKPALTDSPKAASETSLSTHRSSASMPFFSSMTKNKLCQTFKLEEDAVQPINGYEELVDLFDGKESVVVLDVRPYSFYLASRLKGALNICVPTTLLKRKTFTMQSVISTMSQQHKDVMQSKLNDCSISSLDIIIYDESSSLDSCSFHLFETIKKFLQENSKAANDESAKHFNLFILQNGFSDFQNRYKLFDPLNLIDTTPVLLSPSSPLSQNSQLTSPSVSPETAATTTAAGLGRISTKHTSIPAPLSGFSLPPNRFSNIVDESILKKQSASNLQSENEDDLDHGELVVPEHIKDVPLWLLPFTDKIKGYKLAKKRFVKIEKIENRRLRNLISNTLNHKTQHFPQQNAIPHNHKHLTNVSDDELNTPAGSCNICDKIDYSLPAEGLENGIKNRYSNIWPYEHSRVKLSHSQSVSHLEMNNEYFNASYVTVPLISSKRYIATQEPLETTLQDFWRCCLNNKVPMIICLTSSGLESGVPNNVPKYYHTQHFKDSNISVTLLKEEKNADCSSIVRTIQVSKEDKVHTVTQIEFQDWPDFGIPPSALSILKLIDLKNRLLEEKKLSTSSNKDSTIMVHCSAGCGRTGTFITIDLLLDSLNRTLEDDAVLASPACSLTTHSPFSQLSQKLFYDKTAEQVDIEDKAASAEDLQRFHHHNSILNFYKSDLDLVYKTVNELRRLRVSMVQNLSQYIICYEAVLKYLELKESDHQTNK